MNERKVGETSFCVRQCMGAPCVGSWGSGLETWPTHVSFFTHSFTCAINGSILLHCPAHAPEVAMTRPPPSKADKLTKLINEALSLFPSLTWLAYLLFLTALLNQQLSHSDMTKHKLANTTY